MPGPDDSLMLSILKELRAEMRDHRTLLLQLAEASRRHDRRFSDLERRLSDMGGELELMLKSELPRTARAVVAPCASSRATASEP